MNIVHNNLCALAIALCFVPPSFGNDDVPLTAVPIERFSLVPPASVAETIETPEGRFRGLKPFGEIGVKASVSDGPLPEDYSSDYFPGDEVQLEDMRQIRDWPAAEYHWQAPNLCHRPLYFEQPALESSGQSVLHEHLQPMLSGARFFLTIPLLPLKVAHTPPDVHISTAGISQSGIPPACCAERECER